jgi:3-hydroxybutyryl-CoA dehydrogenase
MGKETVLVRESPGFITSRVNVMIGNEAFYMLREGVASARDIDKALKLGLNHPLGPFEARRSRRPRHAPEQPRVPAPQHGRKLPSLPTARAVREGRALGRKVGRGVYSIDASPCHERNGDEEMRISYSDLL